jgi:hypothetical protein
VTGVYEMHTGLIQLSASGILQVGDGFQQVGHRIGFYRFFDAGVNVTKTCVKEER